MERLEYNDLIRDTIDRNVDYTGFTPVNSSFVNKIKTSILLNSRKDIAISSAILSVIFLDTYKELTYSIRNQIASDTEYELYSLICQFKSFDDIKEFYKNEEELILDGIYYTKDFYNSTELKQISVMRCLTEADNDYLSELVPIHNEDLDSYDFVITKDFLYDYYLDSLEYLKDENGHVDDIGVVLSISGFLKGQAIDNFDEVAKIVASINKDVFTNYDRLKEQANLKTNAFDDLKVLYNNDPDVFNMSILQRTDLDMIDSVMNMYFYMRRTDFLKSKKYKKD